MTIPELIFYNTRKFSEQTALAYKFKNRFQGITFAQLKSAVYQLKNSLITLGASRGDTIALFSENRPEWVMADLAIQLLGAITVPIHSVFQPKYIKHVIDDSGAKILFISDSHLFEKLYQAHETLNLKKIIYFSRNRIFGLDREKFIYFRDLIKTPPPETAPTQLSLIDEPATTTATIVYTSGTTGLPKGVVLSHRNLISNIQASARAIFIGPQDRFLSFLPLSHIFERTAGYYTPLAQGAAIYYAGDYRDLAADLQLAKPTILVGVPRVFEKAYEKISGKKSFQIVNGLPGGNILLRRIIKKRFGGRIKFCISGGATLDPSISKFFHNFGLAILEGYGLTETSPVVSTNRLKQNRFGTCGLPLDNLEVKLAADNELLVKGPSVAANYHRLPLASKESLTEDGFFKTGDFAKIDEDGYIKILGRKKNIIVLSTGKKVQPEEIESALDASPYINQSMIIGEGRKMITAIITPAWDTFKNDPAWAQSSTEMQERMAYSLIRSEINQLLADFPDHEQIKKIILLVKPFSVEEDELSPTLKLKRKVIEKNYQREIEEMYRQ